MTPAPDIASVLQEVVEAARNDPERETSEIVGEAVTRLGGDKATEIVHHRKFAEEALESAKRQADDLGEHPDVANLDAMIGIGFALLALGQDAEVFFSLFAGHRGEGS